MGVKRIILMRTWRVEKSYFESPVLKEESLRELFVWGLEQGCDTVFPDIKIRRLFRPFMEDEAPELIRNTHALAAHPHAEVSFPFKSDTPITLAIGPEGGFVDFELELLQKTGFELKTLGPRPLRVEQALPAILGRLF
jgi:RsmE family RNA methyltransferase